MQIKSPFEIGQKTIYKHIWFKHGFGPKNYEF